MNKETMRAVLLVALLLAAYFLGRLTTPPSMETNTQTVTVAADAAPVSPRILAAWEGDPSACATAICQDFTFTAPSYFYLVSTCTLNYTPADAPAMLTAQVFDKNGVLLKTMEYSCGGSPDPSIGTKAISIITPSLPQGTYTVKMSSENEPVFVSLMVVAA